jgi:hypothetical protein
MPDIRYIDKDFVRFTFSDSDGQEQRATLAFGDKVDVLEEGEGRKPSCCVSNDARKRCTSRVRFTVAMIRENLTGLITLVRIMDRRPRVSCGVLPCLLEPSEHTGNVTLLSRVGKISSYFNNPAAYTS